MESRYLQWRVRTRYIDTLHPPGGQVQVVHDVVEAIEHEDDGGGEGGDVPAVDGDPLLHPPPVPLQLGRGVLERPATLPHGGQRSLFG